MKRSSSAVLERSGEDLNDQKPKRVKINESDSHELEETCFSKLVDITLNTVVNLKNVSEDDISSAIRDLKQSFPDKFHEIDLSQFKYSCGYFYRFGAHGAGLTRSKVIKALKNCKDLASKFKEPSLNVFSFGGGPGNDAIGFCSALCEFDSNASEKFLNITVTDLFREWSLYVSLIKIFIEEGNFGNVSELFRNNKTNLTFLEVPPKEFYDNGKYLKSLKNADVILMVKVLSIVKIRESPAIVESIYKEMKSGAFVLYIDTMYEENLWTKFERLYLDPYLGDENHKYFSRARSERFNSNDRVSSKAGIIVFRKK